MLWSFHTHNDFVKLAEELERELNVMQKSLDQIRQHAEITARDRDEWMIKAMKLQKALESL